MKFTRARALLILMSTLTAVCIGSLLYMRLSSGKENLVLGPVYGAYEYVAAVPPEKWYSPEELGIVKITEYGTCLEVIVDEEKEPFPLQREQPIFGYNDKLYQISNRDIDFEPPTSSAMFEIPIAASLSVGWILTATSVVIGKRKK